ncbi:hypothetical protein HY250_03570 [Candidatus Azambacteria bacterium]|nr:hypothetical protein [Candidatus Azambacteria bacterium]MBI3685456.1 hypothetical protein [Candidatus Azambacteria bacterium]
MKLHFSVASKKATAFYLLGLALNHGSFPSTTAKERKMFSKTSKNKRLPPYIVPSSYQLYGSLKASILSGKSTLLDSIFKKTFKQLNGVEIRGVTRHKANVLQKSLRILYDTYREKISLFFKCQKVRQDIEFHVYVLPDFGERAESLPNAIVIGDAFHKKIAFAVVMEEFLHALYGRGFIKMAVSPKTKDKNLWEEAVVGTILFQLLASIGYDKNVSKSIVFGWQSGKREKLVEKLLKILSE